MFVSLQDLTLRLAFAIAAGAFGSAFQHGYNTGVLNAPEGLIKDWIRKCDKSPTDDSSSTETAIINATAAADGTEKECVSLIGMSEAEGVLIWSLVVSFFCVGGMFGGAAIGLVSGYFGR